MNKPPRTRIIAGIGATVAIAAFGFAIPFLMPAPAKAFVAFSFGFPAYPPPPPNYYPPRPPPGYYPPPGTSGPPGAYPPAAAQPPGYSPRRAHLAPIDYLYPETSVDRRFRPAMSRMHDDPEIDGRATKVYGTACRDPGSQWRIVN